MACTECELNDCDCDAPDDALDDREPCGESGCICHCGQGHVCSCDCLRCFECQQLMENCQCDDDEED